MGAETKDNHEQDSRVRWVLRQVGSTQKCIIESHWDGLAGG
jgi:hypothetical protein